MRGMGLRGNKWSGVLTQPGHYGGYFTRIISLPPHHSKRSFLQIQRVRLTKRHAWSLTTSGWQSWDARLVLPGSHAGALGMCCPCLLWLCLLFLCNNPLLLLKSNKESKTWKRDAWPSVIVMPMLAPVLGRLNMPQAPGSLRPSYKGFKSLEHLWNYMKKYFLQSSRLSNLACRGNASCGAQLV